jgi:hypothetical protein
MPLDVRIEQLEHDRQVAAIESVVAALECVDVGAGHAGAVDQVRAGTSRSRCGRPLTLEHAPAVLLVSSDGCADGALARAHGARDFVPKEDLTGADLRRIWA